MTEFTTQELADAPKIVLAGKEYPIPKLAPRQNRRIIPRLSRLGNIMQKNAAGEMTETDVDDAYLSIYWALTRTMPDLKESDFMDMPIDMQDVLAALGTVAQQTGIMKQMEVAPGDAGEQKPVEPAPSTGTTPSPE